MKNILVIGATGQIGSELTLELRKRYGDDHVIAGYIPSAMPKGELKASGPSAIADVTDRQSIEVVARQFKIDTIYNLAALLSVVAESRPAMAWKIGIDGLWNVLEVAREYGCAVFTPSSIGSFGEATPHVKTPQDTIQRPRTMYGVTKVTTELLSDYYYTKYGVDTRAVRFPGIISNVTPPGGGTTDYAVDIFYRPAMAWKIGIDGLWNVLEVAREYGCAVFTPSSIGSFGEATPHVKTPQDTIQRPRTMYGVTKVTTELLSDYYYTKYGVDTRAVRFPGIISNVTPPGGGTTDYAVDIFYSAVKGERFVCPLKPGTYMDMMYMPDALNAAISLMEAAPARLKHRNAFNIAAMSFDPEEIYQAIKKHVPDFEMVYEIDPLKQSIADSWPDSLDDTCAREEWDWKPQYDLESMTVDMLEKLRAKLNK